MVWVWRSQFSHGGGFDDGLGLTDSGLLHCCAPHEGNALLWKCSHAAQVVNSKCCGVVGPANATSCFATLLLLLSLHTLTLSASLHSNMLWKYLYILKLISSLLF